MLRWRTRHRGSHAEHGAAAVEFAIVLVVLLLILLGIIDFGRLLFVSQSVKSASREGARVAAVQSAWGPNTSTGTVLNGTVQAAGSAVGMAGGGSLTVVGTANGVSRSLAANPTDVIKLCNSGTPPNTEVTVRVSVLFNWLTPVGALAGGGFGQQRTVGSETIMRCE